MLLSLSMGQNLDLELDINLDIDLNIDLDLDLDVVLGFDAIRISEIGKKNNRTYLGSLKNC